MIDYEKQDKLMSQAFSKAAKGSDNKVLKQVAKEEDTETKDKLNMQCDMVHRLLRESMDMYKDGDLTFEEAIDDFAEAAKAIEIPDVPHKKGNKSESMPMVDED